MALVNYRGSLSSVEPFDVYQKYLAMKNHFSNKGGYDYHQYNGKVRANKTSFEVRRDKYFFYKLSKLKNVEEYLLANFVDGDKGFWAGSVNDDSAERVYTEFKKRQQSLTYVYNQDLNSLKDDFNDNIIVPPNEHPYLLRLYMRKDICIETLTILDILCKIFDYWDKHLVDDPVWSSTKMKVVKYRSFISVDINKYRDITISRFK
tara:strand:+ start:16086 stop:16700 length:615 start_codon:yes stop_codon:yes gene_type:complete